jgi:hypothetical protein
MFLLYKCMDRVNPLFHNSINPVQTGPLHSLARCAWSWFNSTKRRSHDSAKKCVCSTLLYIQSRMVSVWPTRSCCSRNLYLRLHPQIDKSAQWEWGSSDAGAMAMVNKGWQRQALASVTESMNRETRSKISHTVRISECKVGHGCLTSMQNKMKGGNGPTMQKIS